MSLKIMASPFRIGGGVGERSFKLLSVNHLLVNHLHIRKFIPIGASAKTVMGKESSETVHWQADLLLHTPNLQA